MSVQPVAGDYSGVVVINKVNGKTIPPINTGLVASVYQEGGQVRVLFNSNKSLIFPYQPLLSGSLLDTSSAAFGVAGTIALAPHSALNPYPGKAITRDIWLETTAVGSGNNTLGGAYWETIQDMVARPINVEGTFDLRKVSDEPAISWDEIKANRFGELTVTVKDAATALPISGATVTVTGAGISDSELTGADGLSSFLVPFAGNPDNPADPAFLSYLVYVQAPDYWPGSANVTFTADSLEQTITLQHRSGVPGDPPLPWPPNPQGNTSQFRWWTAWGLNRNGPIVTGAGRAMTVMAGYPVIGGTAANDGYVSQSRRLDKILWSGPLPIGQ